MPALLALSAAACWGTTDFLGGVASRHATARAVATVAQLGGLITAVLALPLLWGDTSVSDAAWGFGGGASGAIAVMILYRGFQQGRISLTSPIAAVGTALFPAAVGIAAGDAVRGLEVAGSLVAIASIWVLAGGGRSDERGAIRASILFGVFAGLGFALLLIALAQVEGSLGVPLVASKAGGAVALFLPSVIERVDLALPPRAMIPAVAGGVVAVLGNVAFLAASGDERLAIVSVLAAMFPAFTVGLAVIFLGEHLGMRRVLGIALALVGIALIVA